uniref:TIL domain-containing protein n=1 Tax=Sinocyclocheilus grahami TaxID=75366 RepID=A0A672K9J5_SINGR
YAAQLISNMRMHVCVGMVCLGGMMYHPCTSACGRTCQSISSGEVCDGDCAEGCSCTEGTFYDHLSLNSKCIISQSCNF